MEELERDGIGQSCEIKDHLITLIIVKLLMETSWLLVGWLVEG